MVGSVDSLVQPVQQRVQEQPQSHHYHHHHGGLHHRHGMTFLIVYDVFLPSVRAGLSLPAMAVVNNGQSSTWQQR